MQTGGARYFREVYLQDPGGCGLLRARSTEEGLSQGAAELKLVLSQLTLQLVGENCMYKCVNRLCLHWDSVRHIDMQRADLATTI